MRRRRTKATLQVGLNNWPVRWKVFAIVLVPLILAGAFGGLRIYSGATDAADLQRRRRPRRNGARDR